MPKIRPSDESPADLAKRINHFLGLIAAEPNETVHHENLGYAYLVANDRDKALECFTVAMREYCRKDRIPDANKIIAEMLENDYSFGTVMETLYGVGKQLDDPASKAGANACYTLLQEAAGFRLASEPESERTHYLLARTLHRLGKGEEAFSHYLKTMRLTFKREDEVQARNYCAFIWGHFPTKSKEICDALYSSEKGLLESDTDTAYHCLTKVRDEVHRKIREEPQDPSHHRTLGKVFFVIGDKEDDSLVNAANSFAQAATLFSRSGKGKEAMEAIGDLSLVGRRFQLVGEGHRLHACHCFTIAHKIASGIVVTTQKDQARLSAMIADLEKKRDASSADVPKPLIKTPHRVLQTDGSDVRYPMHPPEGFLRRVLRTLN